MTDKENNSNNSRPPVVVILGHVDHGKTTILDTIRKTKVAAKEAGGITQHIGAYQIENDGKLITFLDTPGHEAFSAIRSRGAMVADVAVLVVAADEGIKPQTKESVKILKETKTPFIVAVNKMDKNGAEPMKVRQELAELEVLVEDYGGDVPVAEISGLNGDGIDHLVELIQLVAELEELKDEGGVSRGVVIEAHMDSKRGIVSTLLVQAGTLSVSDWIVVGSATARVKSLEDFKGERIKSASASQPCVVTGWDSLPGLGVEFTVAKDKKSAEKAAKVAQTDDSKLFDNEITNELVVNIIVKSDVKSSLDAIDQTLRTIKSQKASYKVVYHDVGNISDSDVKKAKSMNAAIVGFHVDVDKSAAQMAERQGIEIRQSDIIYKLVEAVREIMTVFLPIEIERTSIGRLKVLATFGMSGKAQIFGGKVVKGKAVRGSGVDILKNDKYEGSGKLTQLQQAKADVKEVKEGLECGIKFEPTGEHDVQVVEGDVVEFFEEKKLKQQL